MFANVPLKGHVGTISPALLTALVRALKGNPYLVNWFNPSIALVHGLVSVTDKRNVISGPSPPLVDAPKASTGGQMSGPFVSESHLSRQETEAWESRSEASRGAEPEDPVGFG